MCGEPLEWAPCMQVETNVLSVPFAGPKMPNSHAVCCSDSEHYVIDRFVSFYYSDFSLVINVFSDAFKRRGWMDFVTWSSSNCAYGFATVCQPKAVYLGVSTISFAFGESELN